MSEKTRVLFLSSPQHVAADTAVHFLLLRSLDPEKYDLHAAAQIELPGAPAPAFHKVSTFPGVRVRPTDFGPTLFGHSRWEKLASARRAVPTALSLAGLVRYMKEHRIQVVHSTDRPRDAMTCAVLGELTGARSVIHVHVKFDTWMGRGVRAAFGRANALIGVSEFVGRSLVQGGYRSERVFPVLNAVEPHLWDPEMDPRPGRESLGLSPTTPLVVTVSRLFKWKGHTDLIRSLVLVKKDVPDVRLAVVGDDYPPGSGTTKELRELADGLGLKDNVIFTGYRNDIPALMAASDVFALMSFEEPFGLVYAEAMAMKKPCLATLNGGAPEVVDHEKSGLLSRPGDLGALATDMIRLLKDPALRARMGAFGRDQVLARFTPDRMARDVGDVYSRILA